MRNVLLVIFVLWTLLKVEYIDVPLGGGSGWRQDIRLSFEEGIIQVERRLVKQTVIPYGKVFVNEYLCHYAGETCYSISRFKEKKK